MKTVCKFNLDEPVSTCFKKVSVPGQTSGGKNDRWKRRSTLALPLNISVAEQENLLKLIARHKRLMGYVTGVDVRRKSQQSWRGDELRTTNHPSRRCVENDG